MFRARELLKKYNFSWSQLQYIFSCVFSEDALGAYLENKPLSRSAAEKLDRIASLYSRRIPLEYILGRAAFYGLTLKVNSSVLIPRPETEIMVEKIIDYLRSLPRPRAVVLDLCTGSGNIGLALAKEFKDAVIISSDISFSALKVAKANFSSFNCRNIFPVCGDMFSAFKEEKFDIIAANPPYVESGYLKEHPALHCEPAEALKGGEDGLDFIRKIISTAASFLKKKGRLFMEIGRGQSLKAKEYVRKNPRLRLREVFCDYSGIERVITAEKV